MNGASVAYDTASEALQHDASATSLRSADAGIKAMDAQSGPSEDPGNKNHSPTQDQPQQDTIERVNESQVSDFQNISEGQHRHDEDSKEDVRIPDWELKHETEELEMDREDGMLDEYRLKERRERGIKYAKAAAVYTGQLETRVGWLEREVIELQYEIGSKKRPNDERQAKHNFASLPDYTPTC